MDIGSNSIRDLTRVHSILFRIINSSAAADREMERETAEGSESPPPPYHHQ